MESPLTDVILHPSPVTQVHESCVDQTEGFVLIPFYPGIFLLFVRTKQVFAETDEESTLCLISSDVYNLGVIHT